MVALNLVLELSEVNFLHFLGVKVGLQECAHFLKFLLFTFIGLLLTTLDGQQGINKFKRRVLSGLGPLCQFYLSSWLIRFTSLGAQIYFFLTCFPSANYVKYISSTNHSKEVSECEPSFHWIDLAIQKTDV